MNLLQESREYDRWLSRVLGRFLRVRPLLTITTIGATTLSGVANLLAFFLPLKVIILVGSDGVPRYFRFFMDPDDKMPWVIGLSLGAVGLYALSMALDALADRCAHVGSAWVLREANELTLVNNQSGVAREYFARICSACGALLFVLVAFVGGLLLNFWVFVLLAGLLCLQYLFTALLLRRYEPGAVRGRGAYVAAHIGEYLNILGSANFLAVFGFIVAGFLWLGQNNLIVGILSILLGRQLQQNVTTFITQSLRLAPQKAMINTLVFKDHQLLRPERTVFQRFRRLFGSGARRRRIGQVRTLAGLSKRDVIRMKWIDPLSIGLAMFEWTVSDRNKPPKQQWLERIHFPSRHSALEHETFLFRHLDASSLRALPQQFRYTADQFVSQFYDYGLGVRLPRNQWPRHSLETTCHFLALQPPRALQEAYFGSKPILDARLHDDFVARVDVAIDSDADAQRVAELMEALPRIRSRIRELPLCIHNPDIGPETAVLYAEGDVRFIAWGRWALEPVGYKLNLFQLTEERLGKMVDAVRSRSDCPTDFSATDLRLVAALSQLEDCITKQWHRQALELIDTILAHAAAPQSSSPAALLPVASNAK
ncbi:MAG TPA: hypothetical protein VF210_01255 [Pseudomonadales bacterium]